MLLSKKTKASFAGAQIALIISLSTCSAISITNNYELHKEVKAKDAEFKALDLKLNELEKRQEDMSKTNKDLSSKNSELQKYINDNRDTMKNAEDLRKQNEELTKQNKALQMYYDSNNNMVPSRGSSINVKKVSIRKITVELSMYTKTGNKTASGIWPHWGIIAAPAEIAMGSSLIIPGVQGLDKQVFKVADTGSYIKKVGDVYRIDIYTEKDDAYARKFGRLRNIEAYLIEETPST